MNKILLTILFFLILQINSAYSLDYDFSSTEKVQIKLSPTEKLSTKMPLEEGQKINFKIKQNVNYKGETLFNQGDIVTGRLETVITSGMNGFPAEIIIDNFEIPNTKSSQLIGTYTKSGQNRCYLVYPLKWALTLIPFVGSLTNFIKGGHATIKPKDTITVDFYPEWK